MTELIKAGDVSSRYGVSTRTLRYYEEIGLMQSRRIEDYAYRMYDDANIKRLEQILILRKLNVSIKDIRRIFDAAGSEAVLEVLGKKVEDIDEEVALLHELKAIVIAFIRQIEQADFSKDADVKLLYDKAREIETHLVKAEYTGNPAPVHRLFEITEKLEEKAASRLLIPDNVLKRILRNVFFIWGSNEGIAVADELGRRYGIFVYHTCQNRSKHSQNADPKFQPGLSRDVPDFWAQDPGDAMRWEREVVRDYTPMVIMDLIQLTAKHERVICENDIDVDSILQFVTHAVRISNGRSWDDFYDRFEAEVHRLAICEEEKEKRIRMIGALRKEARRQTANEMKRHGVKQIVWDDQSTVEKAADIAAAYFGWASV